MKKGFTGLELVIIICVVCILAFMAVPKLSDVKDSSRAAGVQRDLTDMRVALEEYYQRSGEYPELTGKEEELSLVETAGLKGEMVNFGKILGRRSIPATPRVEELEAVNRVYDTEDFSEVSSSGGWNYNYTGRTGEIHVNLPEDIFRQSIDWSRQ